MSVWLCSTPGRPLARPAEQVAVFVQIAPTFLPRKASFEGASNGLCRALKLFLLQGHETGMN